MESPAGRPTSEISAALYVIIRYEGQTSRGPRIDDDTTLPTTLDTGTRQLSTLERYSACCSPVSRILPMPIGSAPWTRRKDAFGDSRIANLYRDL